MPIDAMPTEEDYIAGNPALRGTNVATVVSGCSGGGKSTLLEAMARRGYRVTGEAGRQIVRDEILIGGDGLPWADIRRWVDLTASRAMGQYNAVRERQEPTLFDRSLVDIIAFLPFNGLAVPDRLRRALAHYRYAATVFMVPPWPALYRATDERRKDFAQAIAEYEHLCRAYRAEGYTLVDIPQAPVKERADFLAARLATPERTAG